MCNLCSYFEWNGTSTIFGKKVSGSGFLKTVGFKGSIWFGSDPHYTAIIFKDEIEILISLTVTVC